MKKVVFVSSSRADEGHLAPFILACASDVRFRTYYLALASSPSRELFERINSQVSAYAEHCAVQLPSESGNWGRYLQDLISCVETFIANQFSPEDEVILILLGDRLEMLSITSIAVARNIPIVHVHGGESSFGSTDDSVRHAITKLSSFHFPSTKNHARNLGLLGESVERIGVSGALAVDTVEQVGKVDDSTLSQTLGFEIPTAFAMATFHPPTNVDNFTDELGIFKRVLKEFPYRLILSAPNHDPGSSLLRSEFATIVDKSSGRITFHENFGFENYVRLLRRANLVIGNSSSGLIEAPIVGVPSIDIGARQAGREAPQSVFRVGLDFELIMSTISKLHENPKVEIASNFYGSQGVALRMLESIYSNWALIRRPKWQTWQAIGETDEVKGRSPRS